MGDVISFPIPLDSDLGRELIVDLCRFKESVLDEKFIRRKYRLTDAAWQAMGADDALVEKIEAESIRRVRDGSSKREKAQKHVVRAPDVLSSIMDNPATPARNRVDAVKTLDSLAANGPQGVPPADRFVITIVLNSDDGGANVIEHYDKSIKIDPNDTPAIPAIAEKKNEDDDDGRGYF
jgi:hypothetical protein